ncbi:hypothetical protein GCM10017786_32850 [Amycolatopsis deserti]|uniref:Uncharacterized protein n=1 Tax=Amycolatopsis deserti TaxID=185696 RepID=A0ABQ3J1L7_9PSEU|nr:hypothetical protein GCM10017786_32850 [Amycolatopsis deserti]
MPNRSAAATSRAAAVINRGVAATLLIPTVGSYRRENEFPELFRYRLDNFTSTFGERL